MDNSGRFSPYEDDVDFENDLENRLTFVSYEEDFESNVLAQEKQKFKTLEIMRRSLIERRNSLDRSNCLSLSPVISDRKSNALSDVSDMSREEIAEFVTDAARQSDAANFFEDIPEPLNLASEYRKLVITDTNEPISEENKEACKILKTCMSLREVIKFIYLYKKMLNYPNLLFFFF